MFYLTSCLNQNQKMSTIRSAPLNLSLSQSKTDLNEAESHPDIIGQYKNHNAFKS